MTESGMTLGEIKLLTGFETQKIEATFENDTVWLSIDQMADLFQRDRSVIGKHVRNIFKKGELDKNAVWAEFAYTASDRKDCEVDLII